MRRKRDTEPIPADIAGPLLTALVRPLPAELERAHRIRIEAALSEAARTAAPRSIPSVGARHASPVGRFSRAASRSRIAVAAGAAVLAAPFLLAGLATAGVKLPAPATSAFERVGITLPNQAAPATAEDQVPGRGEPVSGEKPGSTAKQEPERKSGGAPAGGQGGKGRRPASAGRQRPSADSRNPAPGDGPRSERPAPARASGAPRGPAPRPTDQGRRPPAHGVNESPPRNSSATERPDAPSAQGGNAGPREKASPPGDSDAPTVEE